MEPGGRTVLITGGARGRGRAKAETFARAGANVIVTDVDSVALDPAAEELKTMGFDVRTYLLDVSDRAACFKLAAQTGPVDILVNNAGITECDEVLDMAERAVVRMMEVNYYGMVWMKKSGVRFTIVNPGYVNTGMFQGSRIPFITRWQEPSEVAAAIVRAVRKNKGEICVPSFSVRFATFMRGLCLPRFTDIISSMLGGHRSFQTWQKDETRPF